MRDHALEAARIRGSAWQFVLLVGVVNLFADMTY
jgi:hypothetical protein